MTTTEELAPVGQRGPVVELVETPVRDLADVAPRPVDVLDRVRAARAVADRAEAEILGLAVEWAHAHPVLPGDEAWRVGPADGVCFLEDDGPSDRHDPEEAEGYGIPAVSWSAPAAFAAANGMSTTAGRALLRDALVLRHRLPRLWARVQAGSVQAWRARRVAQAVLGAPADVVAAIDAAVAPVAHQVGPVTLARLVQEAMLRANAEDAELAQTDAMASRAATLGVVLDERSVPLHGLAHMDITADAADLRDFDRTLSAVAAHLKHTPLGEHESLDVRRSMAVGVLADPATALALLEGRPAPRPARRTVLYLHLTSEALTGADPLGRDATHAQPVLAQQIRDWCARTDTHLTVTPVIDLNDPTHAVDAYEIPDRIAERVRLADPTCVFPWCHTTAHRADLDHITPHTRGGPTAIHNLAPLCRHHHRLKTHAGWTYTRHGPGTYLWTTPHHHHILRTPHGTTHLTPD